jgi:hypothetical protein
VAGVASSTAGGNALAALRAFDEIGRLFERDRVERLPEVVRRAATTLWLRDASALRVALGLDEPRRNGESASDPSSAACDTSTGAPPSAPHAAASDATPAATPATTSRATLAAEAAPLETEAAL